MLKQHWRGLPRSAGILAGVFENSRLEAGATEPRLFLSEPSQVWVFANLNLMPGFHISLQPANTKAQHQVQFIGALPGKSLITTLPGGLEDRWIKPTDMFVLRGLVNTHAFAINCHPISFHAAPYPHIHFLYPESVLVRQARCCPRVQVKLPVEVTQTDATILVAMLSDISVSGARVLSNLPRCVA